MIFIMREYIICYDICCPRRLAKIHRYLKSRACAIQYSVFLFIGTTAQLDRCLAQLEILMDPAHDDIRAYPLPAKGYRFSIGCSTLPEGIHWGALPATW